MGKCKVLIVDDDKIILHKLLEEFENSGFEVEVVESAEKAIGLFEQKIFDIVFTDLILPGKNGLDLCAHVKKLYPKTEVVLMSGRPNDIEKFQMTFLNLGGRDEALRKPLLENEVLNAAVKIRKELQDSKFPF